VLVGFVFVAITLAAVAYYILIDTHASLKVRESSSTKQRKANSYGGNSSSTKRRSDFLLFFRSKVMPWFFLFLVALL
jgi:hypothetical protein